MYVDYFYNRIKNIKVLWLVIFSNSGIFSIFRGNPPGGSIYGLGIGLNLPEAPLFIEMLQIA